MNLPIYQVDAFTSKLFGGNPAAICPLTEWLDEKTMQNIALENNLSETAFFIKENDSYHIRWFTPTEEVPLCGHATLASSFIIFNYLNKSIDKIKYISKSGELIVEKQGDLLCMNFPANIPIPAEPPSGLIEAIGLEPKEILFNDSFFLVYESESDIKKIVPDIRGITKAGVSWVIITASGDEVDFVSRFFAPGSGIDEDPVTGYAHTLLTPYWSEKLKKSTLRAKQLSKRGGEIFVENLGNNRVKISGRCAFYLEGKIVI
jgi:PhzF family phenazine biosynthesis protein